LWQKKEFFQGYRAEALVAHFAADRYQADARGALDWARQIKSPFFSSLAVGACAARCIKSDPLAAQQLVLGAQERALSNHGYVGSDATSLNYLFQLTPLFEPALAKPLLTASRRNVQQWFGDGLEKSKPTLELAHQVVALEPASVDDFLKEITADKYLTNHLYESIQFLGTHLARTRKDWAAAQVAAFYESGKGLPGTDTVLFNLIMEDALNDLPKALGKIKAMGVDDQGQALFYVARALRDGGRLKESAAIVEDIQARINAKAEGTGWIAGVLPPARERWAADDERDKIAPPAPPGAEQIDAFMARPETDRRFLDNRNLHFRDAKQAMAFVEKALPLARAATDPVGGRGSVPGGRRGAILGNLSHIAALAGDPARAKTIADEITVPEMRAFYCLVAYEVSHPLPAPARSWPIFLFTVPENRIGP
jgi:hypothetical protein